MRKAALFSTFVLVVITPAIAQETPQVETFVGYSYVRGNAGDVSAFGDTPAKLTTNLHGGSGSITYNMDRWFGVVADFGAYKLSKLDVSGLPSISVDTTLVTYLFGPRFSYRKHERATPFVQFLFGGAHLGDVTSGGTTITGAENGFAMTMGGGLDVRAHNNVAIRLFQTEYLLTRFTDPNSATGAKTTQNNFRLSAGIVLRFGQR